MRTIKGYEAIEIAEKYDLPMYDLYYKNPLSVEEVKQFIRSRRDPETFAIQNWPDTEEEGEQIVLSAYHVALKDHHLSAAHLEELHELGSGLPIHIRAAELAADRLADAGKLEVTDETRDGIRYRIPRTLYLREEFLDDLAGQVCDECARLDIDGPFHETCLMSIVQYLTASGFTTDDITEVRHTQHANHKLTNILRPGIELLSKTVSETRSKLQSVVKKPIFNQDVDPAEPATPPTLDKQADDIGDETIVYKADAQMDSGRLNAVYDSASQSETPQHVDEGYGLQEDAEAAKDERYSIQDPSYAYEETARSQSDTLSRGENMDRARITKEDLIQYLREVELVDETGEIMRLQRERSEWLQRMAQREHEVEQLEKQRAYWETQYHEMNRDMDTMIEAMQIAKRRVGKPATTVVDADIQTNETDGPNRLR